MGEDAEDSRPDLEEEVSQATHSKEPVDMLPEILAKLRLSDPNAENPEVLRQRILERLSLAQSGPAASEHKFWNTQLVSKLDEVVTLNECGPIDKNEDVERVKKNPYPLPEGFEWVTLDITDEHDRTQVYTLLNENYVEDGDALFRFDYKPEFLVWALTPPNFKKEWQIGVRVCSSKLLVGYITAVPIGVKVMDRSLNVAEVNYLCIHKKLRSKRLAPVLIKEITRRVNLCGMWQAVYTAGIVIPKPIASCRYWHRPLDIKKLVAARFSGVGRRMTISRAVRIYRVEDVEVRWHLSRAQDHGMRLMEKKDVSSLYKLLRDHLKNFKLFQAFTQEQVQHLFLPREDVVQTFVKSVNGNVTDMLSFYSLPSTVINNPKVDRIRAAYSFYNVATSMPYKRLMELAIFFAKQQGFDVFNALDLMQNRHVFEDLKFGMGDGDLHYYMFNYRVPDLNASDVGIVLL